MILKHVREKENYINQNYLIVIITLNKDVTTINQGG